MTSPRRFWFLVFSFFFSNVSLAVVWYWSVWPWYRLIFLYLFSLVNLYLYFDFSGIWKRFDRSRPFLVSFLVSCANDPKFFQLVSAVKMVFLFYFLLRLSVLIVMAFDLIFWLALFNFSSVYRSLGQFPEFDQTWSNVIPEVIRNGGRITVVGFFLYLGNMALQHSAELDKIEHTKRLEAENMEKAKKMDADNEQKRHQMKMERDQVRHRMRMEEIAAKKSADTSTTESDPLRRLSQESKGELKKKGSSSSWWLGR